MNINSIKLEYLTIMSDLSAKLKILIEEKKITKVELAAGVGLTSQTIANILNGSDAKFSSIERIANYFNVPINYFANENTPSQVTNGNSNIVVGQDNNGKISISECENQLEDALLRIKHLEERLKDKEEMIEILKLQLKK